MEPTRADIEQRIEFLYDEAQSLRAEAAGRLDALHARIEDEEHEIDDMYQDAIALEEEAKQLEDSLD